MSCAIIEKTCVKNAVTDAGEVLGKVAHRQDVITNESYRANRRIAAQLDSSIDVLHQVRAVGIYRPG